jgi:hypothetical protein
MALMISLILGEQLIAYVIIIPSDYKDVDMIETVKASVFKPTSEQIAGLLELARKRELHVAALTAQLLLTTEVHDQSKHQLHMLHGKGSKSKDKGKESKAAAVDAKKSKAPAATPRNSTAANKATAVNSRKSTAGVIDARQSRKSTASTAVESRRGSLNGRTEPTITESITEVPSQISKRASILTLKERLSAYPSTQEGNEPIDAEMQTLLESLQSGPVHGYVKPRTTSKYFMALGTGKDVLPFLRIAGRVKNRHYPKKETEQMVRDVWAEKLAHDQEKGCLDVSLADFFFHFLKLKHRSDKKLIAERGYNLMAALERFRYVRRHTHVDACRRMQTHTNLPLVPVCLLLRAPSSTCFLFILLVHAWIIFNCCFVCDSRSLRWDGDCDIFYKVLVGEVILHNLEFVIHSVYPMSLANAINANSLHWSTLPA